MNLANCLTLSRIFLAFIFVSLLYQHGVFFKVLAAAVFALAALTDYFDGYFAKKYKLSSDFGKLMDPVADKFLILATFFVFVKMGLISAWMFGLIFIREVGITFWRLWMMQRGQVLAAEMLGKYKTVLQITTISVILIFLIFKDLAVTSLGSRDTFFIWEIIIYCLMTLTVLLTLYSGIIFYINNRNVKNV